MATVNGTNNSETLDLFDGVTNGADSIFGFGGNDTIFGLGGNDLILGGLGADTINGGSGTDTSSYSDSSAGVTVSLISNQGFGGAAEGDILSSIENLTGSSHQDFLVGNDGANVLTGLGDNDTLKGGGGTDTLFGDSGNDMLKGGGGADTLKGGSGIDTAAYNESAEGVFVSLLNDVAAYGDAEGDELNSIENLTGSSYHDDLWGNDGVNVLKGMDGDDSLKGYGGSDTMYGGEGHDILDGGLGADIMVGGIGNDTYYVNSETDVVTESAGEGIETVHTNSSYTLSANVENLVMIADAGPMSGTGNALSNTITGNNANNVINGGDGNDILTGGVGSGDDTFVFNTALNALANVDTITDFNDSDDVFHLDDAIFSSLGLGTITADQFYIGAAAGDAADRIIYNQATGVLYYDADGGLGGFGQVAFAQVNAGQSLSNLDFVVV